MVKITLFKPDGTSDDYFTEAQNWMVNGVFLSFTPNGPGNKRVRTTLPYFVEFEDQP